MDRLERDERAHGEVPPDSESLTFGEWHGLDCPAGRDLHLSCEDTLDNDYPALALARRIVIEFPVFTDGRGYSHARRLRAHGFDGVLLAAGDILPDQWPFLERCGFTDLGDPTLRLAAGERPGFRHGYQADEQNPQAAVARG